jgi:hypothetical protein
MAFCHAGFAIATEGYYAFGFCFLCRKFTEGEDV